MIVHLEGVLEQKEPGRVVLDVGGVGYELSIPLSSFDSLPLEGKRVRLLVKELIREDGHDLVGFATEEERRFFTMLTTISGIGPKVALSVLSGISIRELTMAAASNDAKRLTKIQGVGKKMAERIALELRGMLSKGELAAAAVAAARAGEAGGATVAEPPSDAKLRDVFSALVSLGHRPAAAQAALAAAAPYIEPDSDVDEILRNILSGKWK
jgi:Holliday junction DNA helicase RuvA